MWTKWDLSKWILEYFQKLSNGRKLFSSFHSFEKNEKLLLSFDPWKLIVISSHLKLFSWSRATSDCMEVLNKFPSFLSIITISFHCCHQGFPSFKTQQKKLVQGKKKTLSFFSLENFRYLTRNWSFYSFCNASLFCESFFVLRCYCCCHSRVACRKIVKQGH